MYHKKIIIILILFFFGSKVQAKIKFNTELWLHSGQSYSKSLNKIFSKIKNENWTGVELDVYFSENHREFFITHDSSFNENLPKLDDFYLINDNKIWLDFKNLSDIPLSDLRNLKNKLRYISTKNQIFLEGQNFIKLKYLQSEEINIIFNLPIIDNKVYLILMKYITEFMNFKYISVSIDSLSLLEKYFKPSQIFLFTINSSRRLCEFKFKQSVNVILTSISPKKLDCLKK